MNQTFSDWSKNADNATANYLKYDKGFFMAYLNLNSYYYTMPELELNHGYCDFFLLPDLTHYDTKHSYIIELKMLSKKDFGAMADNGRQTKAEEQWEQAVEQINRYAQADTLRCYHRNQGYRP